MVTTRLSLALLIFAAAPLLGQENGFKPLFDGKTLDGWEQHGGKAKYTVEDGRSSARSVPNTPNSFLCTKKDYGDFILEARIQGRSTAELRRADSQPGLRRTEGSSRSKGKKRSRSPPTACTATRSRSTPPTAPVAAASTTKAAAAGLPTWPNNEAARKAFKQDEWNKFRIECQRRLDQDLDQRRAGRRSERRRDPEGAHRPAGPRRGDARGTPGGSLAQYPHPRTVGRRSTFGRA